MKKPPADAEPIEERQLRIVMIDGEPWFVAADICSLIGIRTNVNKAMKAIDPDEYRRIPDINTVYFENGIKPRRGNPSVNVVSESGFYSLMFRSHRARQPGSMPHRIRRWVTQEVLPSIRKTGSYTLRNQVPCELHLGWLDADGADHKPDAKGR